MSRAWVFLEQGSMNFDWGSLPSVCSSSQAMAIHDAKVSSVEISKSGQMRARPLETRAHHDGGKLRFPFASAEPHEIYGSWAALRQEFSG